MGTQGCYNSCPPAPFVGNNPGHQTAPFPPPDGRIEDTGPLTKKRMETIDDEMLGHTTSFIKRAHESGKPFFVWANTTHMHFRCDIACFWGQGYGVHP